MAEAPQPVETDPDFQPLARPRSCTWPLPRPELTPSSPGQTPTPTPARAASPSRCGHVAALCASSPSGDLLNLLEAGGGGGGEGFDVGSSAAGAGELGAAGGCPCGDFPCLQHPPQQQQQQQQAVGPALASVAGPRKSSSSRRNAWGNLSYADLITKAIESAPEKRLTLSQIYEWMVKSVPYFKDKGDSNSSAGWKVSCGGGGRDGTAAALTALAKFVLACGETGCAQTLPCS
ncbi:hypothetical protein lerEdw1_019295 [Lerista edwardsae]|nr:hypothetical protein lerEdw1_019295 [Lerista edwardsae]